MRTQEYTGSDGHRYRWWIQPGVNGVAVGISIPLLPPRLRHESFDGIDGEGTELWVESKIVDQAAADEALRKLRQA